jgi:hypothetical protein
VTAYLDFPAAVFDSLTSSAESLPSCLLRHAALSCCQVLLRTFDLKKQLSTGFSKAVANTKPLRRNHKRLDARCAVSHTEWWTEWYNFRSNNSSNHPHSRSKCTTFALDCSRTSDAFQAQCHALQEQIRLGTIKKRPRNRNRSKTIRNN